MISILVNEHNRLLRNRLIQLSLLVAPVLACIIAIFFSDLLKDNNGNMLNYISNVASSLLVISFLGIGVAGTILTKESQCGMLKLDRVRPVSRSTLLFSKWLTVILYLLYLFILTLVLSIAFGSILFGFEGFGTSDHMFGPVMLQYIIAFMEAVLMVTFTLMVSAVLKNRAFSVGIGIAVFLCMKWITEVFRLFQWKAGIILLFENTKLDQYFFGNEPIYDGMNLLFSLVILGLHFCFFYSVAWWFFVKRDKSV